MSLFNYLGRLAFVAMFFMSALNKFNDFEGTVQHAAAGNWHGLEIPSEQLPYLVGAATALEVLGALAILFGGLTCGGWMIFLFIVGVTPVMHWPLKTLDGAEVVDLPNMIHALKNLTIAGAALMIAYPMVAAPKVKKTSTKGKKKSQ